MAEEEQRKSYQKKYNLLIDGKENVGSYPSLKRAYKHVFDIAVGKNTRVDLELEINYEDGKQDRFVLMKFNPKKALEY